MSSQDRQVRLQKAGTHYGLFLHCLQMAGRADKAGEGLPADASSRRTCRQLRRHWLCLARLRRQRLMHELTVAARAGFIYHQDGEFYLEKRI